MTAATLSLLSWANVVYVLAQEASSEASEVNEAVALSSAARAPGEMDEHALEMAHTPITHAAIAANLSRGRYPVMNMRPCQ